jgi:hypothetical protein
MWPPEADLLAGPGGAKICGKVEQNIISFSLWQTAYQFSPVHWQRADLILLRGNKQLNNHISSMGDKNTFIGTSSLTLYCTYNFSRENDPLK